MSKSRTKQKEKDSVVVMNMMRDNASRVSIENPSNFFNEKLARLYELQDEEYTLSSKLDGVKEEIKQITSIDLPTAMLKMGVVGPDNKGKVSTAAGALVYLRTTRFASVLKEDTGKLHDWLTENGMGEIIKPSVHFKTLNAAVGAIIKEGRGSILPTFIRVYEETVAAVRGRK